MCALRGGTRVQTPGHRLPCNASVDALLASGKPPKPALTSSFRSLALSLGFQSPSLWLMNIIPSIALTIGRTYEYFGARPGGVTGGGLPCS